MSRCSPIAAAATLRDAVAGLANAGREHVVVLAVGGGCSGATAAGAVVQRAPGATSSPEWSRYATVCGTA